jgi:outer membrane receptor for ferrienterochelin and colicins
MPLPFARTALACAVLGASLHAIAETDATSLDNMVISAAGFEQKITEAPASISVISGEELKKKRVSNLAEALSDVEGVDVSGNAGKTGGLNVSIRGMGADYTLILVDGKRQSAAGGVTPNGFGETRFGFLPPTSAIDRIEIIRGPMSTLYGSDAMGGVINIITKKVSSEWGGSVSADTTLQQHREYGDTRGTDLYLSGPLVPEKLGLALRGKYQQRDRSDLSYDRLDGVDGELSQGSNPTRGDTYAAGGRLTFTPSENHDIYLDIDNNQQVFDNSEGQLGTLGAVGGYDVEQRYKRGQALLAYTGRFDFGTLETSYTRNTTETVGRLIPTGTPGKAAGSKRALESQNDILDIKLFSQLGDHGLSVGGQYWEAEMTEGVLDDSFEHTMKSVFVEDEWRLHDDFALTLGMRRDSHSTFGTQDSPRIYGVWNLAGNWTLKGGVSKGFKAPDLEKLANGLNGFTAQGRSPSLGNPDLQPETSKSTELGLYYDSFAGFDANLTLFRNKFDDKLGTESVVNCEYQNVAGCVTVPGPIPWYRPIGSGYPGNEHATRNQYFSRPINVDSAVTRGGELAASWRFAPDWRVSGNYTYTETKQHGGPNDGWPMNDTPRHQANLRLEWQATERLDTWLRTEYRSERFRRTTPAANAAYDAFGDYKSYTVFHLGGNYQVNENLGLSAVVYNLFDRDFMSYKLYNGTSYGNEYNNNQERRRLWLSATYQF